MCKAADNPVSMSYSLRTVFIYSNSMLYPRNIYGYYISTKKLNGNKRLIAMQNLFRNETIKSFFDGKEV